MLSNNASELSVNQCGPRLAAAWPSWPAALLGRQTESGDTLNLQKNLRVELSQPRLREPVSIRAARPTFRFRLRDSSDPV